MGSSPTPCNKLLSVVTKKEVRQTKYGLGFIINVSSARGRTAVVFGAIIVIMLFSFVFDKLGNLLIRKIFQWRYCDDQVE